MKQNPTFLGYIHRVNGVTLEILMPSDVPTENRRIGHTDYRVSQVGSFVRIPGREIKLFGIIARTWIDHRVTPIERWFEVQLVGEMNDSGHFFRGVSTPPGIEDEVHIATSEEMGNIFGKEAHDTFMVGEHISAYGLPAHLNLDRIGTRHAVIVGATGSGKSNAVALIIKSLATQNFPGTQIVLIDPHGEYSAALGHHAKVFSINDATNPLIVPYWALTFDELAWFLVDRDTVTESQQDKILRDKIYDEKIRLAHMLKDGGIDSTLLIPDSPVPFDLRKVWYDLYHEEHATYWEKDNLNKIAYKPGLSGEPLKGNAEQVIPPKFQPASSSGTPPYYSSKRPGLAEYLNKIYMRLKDRNYDFLLKPGEFDGIQKDLPDLVDSWLGHDKPITILNMDGIPFETMDLVIGGVTKILSQTMFWGRTLPGVGRQRPLLFVFEEAHAYLSGQQNLNFVAGYARKAIRRIFKEGRKYGVGALVVSQRPSELDTTIFAETGTFIALRLSNDEDQRLIRNALPDSLAGLTNLLPGLRVGEAIVAGEGVKIPSRIRFPLVEPRPKSEDAEPAKMWREKRVKAPYAAVIKSWRTQKA